MQIHFFFLDYGDAGHVYRIGIECQEKVVAERYLQEHSKDVRYHKSNEPGRKDTGNRKVPIGTIRYCKYVGDKLSTFYVQERVKRTPADPRHLVYPL